MRCVGQCCCNIITGASGPRKAKAASLFVGACPREQASTSGSPRLSNRAVGDGDLFLPVPGRPICAPQLPDKATTSLGCRLVCRFCCLISEQERRGFQPMVEKGPSQLQRRRAPLPIQIPDHVLLYLERQRNLSPLSAPGNGTSAAAMARPSHSPRPLPLDQHKKSITKILYSEEFWKDLSGESRNDNGNSIMRPWHSQSGGSLSQAPRDTELSLIRLLAECSLVLVFLLAGAGRLVFYSINLSSASY